jgi:large subunit ribosomal protein L15
MQPHQVRSNQPRRARKRIGRGTGSGSGTYAGRGLKGQKSRSGGGVRPGFEGGQNPLIKGLPRLRGFTNIFRREYQEVNLERLGLLPDEVTEVTPDLMKRYGLVKSAKRLVKVLGQGELVRPLEVRADRFSKTAREKIEAAGGKAEGR